MKNICFALACALLSQFSFAAEDADKPVVRAGKPALSGIALYSWHEKGSDDWRFAVLPAPNVEKLLAFDEVATKENTIEGVPALKKKIASFALNEKIGWFNMLEKRAEPPGNLVFEFPSKEVIKDLEQYCMLLKVRLNIYLPGGKKAQ